ncbi:MAG: STAS domain-containing protein, partial [Hungatella sp.]
AGIMVDLLFAVEVGVLISAVLFMRRMSDVTTIRSWEVPTEEELTSDPECLSLKAVPRDTLVYEIEGPIFFATVDELLTITAASSTKVMILRMRGVLTIDITALHRLESLALRCRNAGITLILSHVMEQPYSVMEKANFVECVGIENFCANIDEALERAKQLTGSSR